MIAENLKMKLRNSQAQQEFLPGERTFDVKLEDQENLCLEGCFFFYSVRCCRVVVKGLHPQHMEVSRLGVELEL